MRQIITTGDNPRKGNAPTDGGWGWVVAVAAGVMQAVSCSPTQMIFVLFQRIFGTESNSGGVATIMSVFTAVSAMSGILMLRIKKRFGVQKAGLIGAVAVCMGNMGAIFAQSYWVLLISYGVVIGLGFGCMMFAGTINLNEYFVERRTVAMGALHVTNMTISMLYPLLIRILIENFGCEGAHIIITAIGTHAIAAALLLRKSKILILRPENVSSGERLAEPATTQNPSAAKSDSKLESVEQNQEQLIKEDREKELEEVLLIPRTCTVSKKEENKKGRLNIYRMVMNSESIKIMRQPDFQMLAAGVACVICTEIIFFSLHPVYLLTHLSFSMQNASFILVATGAGDFTGRALLMISGKYLANSNKLIFWFAALGSTLLITGFTLLADYISVMVLSAILGVFRGMIYVSATLVYAEHYSVEVFPVAVTTSSFINCIGVLILGPFFGQLRDYTGSYILTFVFLACLAAVCTSLWLGEAIVKYIRKNRTIMISKL